ncbi:Cytochrome P450 [Mycena venus]|uniref:Cytochrome P450 n=1 Tax=Mycena venus TaxID=2733690 RepID=A0A8H7D3E8_9AGAR|nr:Cytochrome P450 [Mycena venus]
MVLGAFLVDILQRRNISHKTSLSELSTTLQLRGGPWSTDRCFRHFSKPINHLQAQAVNRLSFVSELLSMPRNTNDSEEAAYQDLVTWTAGSMYGAGSEITNSTIINFILAMTLYPEVQRRAQDELYKFLPDRLPTIADRESTLYLNTPVKETLRWHPSVPLSLPRRSSEEFNYKG